MRVIQGLTEIISGGKNIDSKVGGEIVVTIHKPDHLHKIYYHDDKQHDNY